MARKRPCKAAGCTNEVKSTNSLCQVCSPACAIQFVRESKEKAYKAKAVKLKRQVRSKDRSYWIKKAQASCNKYIRQRDILRSCISCGTSKPTIQYHAGHYRPASNPATRFDEHNIHKQCSQCNNFKSGNLTHYRPALIAKIGIEHVEFLEKDHPPQKLTIDDLMQIDSYYREKYKNLAHT